MEDKNVPYIVFESAEAKSERCIKRLIIALVIAIILMFASNAIWLYAWMQYDYVDTTTQETVSIDSGEGTANYIGNDGVIVNGKDTSEESDSNEVPDTE